MTSLTQNNPSPTTKDNSLSSDNDSGIDPTMPRLVSRARDINDSESSSDIDSDDEWDRVNDNKRQKARAYPTYTPRRQPTFNSCKFADSISSDSYSDSGRDDDMAGLVEEQERRDSNNDTDLDTEPRKQPRK